LLASLRAVSAPGIIRNQDQKSGDEVTAAVSPKTAANEFTGMLWEVVMIECRRFCALLVLLLLFSCGEDEDAQSVLLPQPVGSGLVVDVTPSLEAVEGLAEGQGKLIIEVQLGADAVTDKIAVKISPVGATDEDSGSGAGGHSHELAAGDYTAALVYTQNEELGSFDGALAGLEVRAGQVSRYKVQITVPIGLLVVRFMLEDRNKQQADISGDVQMALFRAAADPTLVKPVWEGAAGQELMLPKGKFQARASYAPGKDRGEVVEWYRGIEVGATLTRTEKIIVIKPQPLGVRVDAYNYSRDINGGTSVFFFSEGADMSRAIARARGTAGTVVQVPKQISPGKYDVLLLYQPSPMTNPDLRIKKVINGFEIPAEPQALRLHYDLQTPLGAIRMKVMDGEEDVSSSIELRVMRGGADPNAATPALEEFGVSEHFVPAGTYDIYVKWKAGDGTSGKHQFIGVQLGNGYLWEQNFERSAESWEAAPVRVPLEPLRPISWVPPGDDDDSAGDDDDSAAAGKADGAEKAGETP